MGDIATFGAAGLQRLLNRICFAAAAVLAPLLLAGCTPDYDWRDIRSPGGEYWVNLPAKPADMTRRIHLEGLEVNMTMQGARVKDNAFTVALVPLPAQSAEAAGMSSDRILAAMREQMLRNIGASPSMPSESVPVAVVDAAGAKVGTMQLEAVSAQGAGKHAAMRLHARFGLWRGHALQIVAIGPDLDPEQVEHFLGSLRLIRR